MQMDTVMFAIFLLQHNAKVGMGKTCYEHANKPGVFPAGACTHRFKLRRWTLFLVFDA